MNEHIKCTHCLREAEAFLIYKQNEGWLALCTGHKWIVTVGMKILRDGWAEVSKEEYSVLEVMGA